MAVYFVSNKATRSVKVGHVVGRDRGKVLRNLYALQRGNEHHLEIDVWVPGWDKDDEREIHFLLRDTRIRGEWFASSRRTFALFCLLTYGNEPPEESECTVSAKQVCEDVRAWCMRLYGATK